MAFSVNVSVVRSQTKFNVGNGEKEPGEKKEPKEKLNLRKHLPSWLGGEKKEKK